MQIDRFKWSMRTATIFHSKAQDFTERVFRRIFAQYFADEANTASSSAAAVKMMVIEPMAILKALGASVSSSSNAVSESQASLKVKQ